MTLLRSILALDVAYQADLKICRLFERRSVTNCCHLSQTFQSGRQKVGRRGKCSQVFNDAKAVTYWLKNVNRADLFNDFNRTQCTLNIPSEIVFTHDEDKILARLLHLLASPLWCSFVVLNKIGLSLIL